MAFHTSKMRKQKEIEEKIQTLLRRMEALDDHIIARTGNQSGKMKVSLNLARHVEIAKFQHTKHVQKQQKDICQRLKKIHKKLEKQKEKQG